MTSGCVRERRETKTPPRRAPALGSRFRENDGGGVRTREYCWWRRGSRSRGTGASRSAPTMRLRSLGCDGCLEWGCPAPLDSCLRRNDEWGCAGTTRDGDAPAPRPCPGFPLSRERRWGSAGRQAPLVAKGWGVPLWQDGRFAKRPYSKFPEAAGGWAQRKLGRENPLADVAAPLHGSYVENLVWPHNARFASTSSPACFISRTRSILHAPLSSIAI